MSAAEPMRDDDWKRSYRRAGAIYFFCGLAIFGVTVLSPGLAGPERRADLMHLLVGLPFFAVFAALIAWGDRLLGRSGQQILTLLLTLSALGRTAVFFGNFVGQRPRLTPTPHFEAVEPQALMGVNAALMAVIVVALVRVAWIPLLKGRGLGK